MTKETFINTLELLKRQQNLNCGLAQALQITLRRAFPDVYDWICGGLPSQTILQYGRTMNRSDGI